MLIVECLLICIAYGLPFYENITLYDFHGMIGLKTKFVDDNNNRFISNMLIGIYNDDNEDCYKRVDSLYLKTLPWMVSNEVLNYCTVKNDVFHLGNDCAAIMYYRKDSVVNSTPSERYSIDSSNAIEELQGLREWISSKILRISFTIRNEFPFSVEIKGLVLKEYSRNFKSISLGIINSHSTVILRGQDLGYIMLIYRANDDINTQSQASYTTLQWNTLVNIPVRSLVHYWIIPSSDDYIIHPFSLLFNCSQSGYQTVIANHDDGVAEVDSYYSNLLKKQVYCTDIKARLEEFYFGRYKLMAIGRSIYTSSVISCLVTTIPYYIVYSPTY